jgi:hypothetical protein
LDPRQGTRFIHHQNTFSIPVAPYYDPYTWAKYGNHILPSAILLNLMENLQTHSLYHNALRHLLCTDLDGNLSTPLNPPTKAKLNEYISTFFRGKSKSTTLGNIFDNYTKKAESRKLFGAKVREIALSATIISLSLFTIFLSRSFQGMSIWS